MPADERPDDVLSFLVGAEHEGAPLTLHHQLGSCFLLLLAGIDTTWSAIGAGLWHLATHPDDQARLRAEPELLPTAVEEVLRFYSPVTMAREVVADVEFAGCPMHAGDKVLLTFPAGNRDPAIFDDPDEFQIDRAAQPPLRLRRRHPPLPRLQPRPHGAARRHGDVPRPHPDVHDRRRRRRRTGQAARCAAPATSPCAGDQAATGGATLSRR